MPTKNHQKPKAYSYVRFSTTEQSNGDSFRRQTEAAEKYALDHGLELDDELSFSDLGVSAFSGANIRNGALGQFLRAVDDGEIAEGSVLLVENLDRVSRDNPWEAFPVFQQIINAGITLVTLQDGQKFTRDELRANPMIILGSLFSMIRANEESETKSRRLSAVWVEKRRKALESKKPVTRQIPAWIRVTSDGEAFELIPERANIIRRIFRQADEGMGQHQIAELLNKDGEDTFGTGARKAAYWHRSYIAKILKNPATIGTFTPRRVSRIRGRKVTQEEKPILRYYPKAISKAVFERVNNRRRSKVSPRISATKGQVSNILAGLAKCPICSSTMTRVNKGRKSGTPYLVCVKAKAGAGCDYKAVKLDSIEAAIQHAGGRQLRFDIPASDPEIAENIRVVDSEMEGLSSAISNIVDEIEAGHTSPTLLNRLSQLEQQRQEAGLQWQHLMDRAEKSAGRTVKRNLEKLEEALSGSYWRVSEINTALRDAFDKVVVDYKNGCLQFYWSHTNEPTQVHYTLTDD